MEIEFDSDKDEANRQKHGLSLRAASELDLDRALVVRDERQDYGEPRFRAMAPIRGRLHVLVFTMRGQVLRPISLRRANPRERRRYERRQNES